MAHLRRQRWNLAVVVLAQRQSRFGSELDQVPPSPLQQFATGWISDGFFLHRAVDNHFLKTLTHGRLLA